MGYDRMRVSLCLSDPACTPQASTSPAAAQAALSPPLPSPPFPPLPSPPLPTVGADLPRADEVTLVAHEDDGSVRQRLPEEQAELRGAVEAAAVRQREHQDAHLALQRRQVLSITHSERETYINRTRAQTHIVKQTSACT